MSINLNIDRSVFDHTKGDCVIITNGETITENLNDSIEQKPELESVVFDESHELCSGVLVKVNGRFIQSDQLSTQVKDGDTIEILKYDG